MMRQLMLVGVLIAVFCIPMTAMGSLVGVEVRVPGNLAGHSDSQGGPLWTGIVDTEADVLFIRKWTEQPDSIDYWSPADTEFDMIWTAVGANGAPYDVPDSFDGTIDGTFAFISAKSVHEMAWKEGIPQLHPAATFYPGWGGARYIPNGQQQLVYDVAGTEEDMPKLLVTPDGLGIVAADDAIVTIVDVSSISPVPEASAVLVWSVLTAGVIIAGRLRRMRSLC